MNTAITGQHWDRVHRTRPENKARWIGAILKASMIRLIESGRLPKTAPVIDVGAGLSRRSRGLRRGWGKKPLCVVHILTV